MFMEREKQQNHLLIMSTVTSYTQLFMIYISHFTKLKLNQSQVLYFISPNLLLSLVVNGDILDSVKLSKYEERFLIQQITFYFIIILLSENMKS